MSKVENFLNDYAVRIIFCSICEGMSAAEH